MLIVFLEYKHSVFNVSVKYICEYEGHSLFSVEGQLYTFARVLSLCAGILKTFIKQVLCLLFGVDMRILIDKALTHYICNRKV